MASKRLKKLNAFLRDNGPVRPRVRFAFSADSILGRFARPSEVQIGVEVPAACGGCMYREHEMRDGGWCYMYRTCPTGLCASFICLRDPKDVNPQGGRHAL